MSRHYDEDVGAVCDTCSRVIEDSSVRIDMGDMYRYFHHRSCYEVGIGEQQGRGRAFQKASGREKFGADPVYN